MTFSADVGQSIAMESRHGNKRHAGMPYQKRSQIIYFMRRSRRLDKLQRRMKMLKTPADGCNGDAAGHKTRLPESSTDLARRHV